MSVEAISWAFGQKVGRSSAKSVLVAMANCADPDMVCWPSMKYLEDATDQDRKTVIENIRRLKELGLIEATGARKGRTGQVVVYVLKQPENGTVQQARNRNGSENGTVPFFPSKGPVFPAKQARKRDTEPKGTVMETKRACFALPDWISRESWEAYMEMRKAAKKVPTTKAINMVIKRLEQFRTEQHDPNAALDQSTRNNWVDVYPVKSMASATAKAAPIDHLSAEEQFTPKGVAA